MYFEEKQGSLVLGMVSFIIVLALHMAAAYWLFSTTGPQLMLLSMASEDLSEGASKGGAIEFVSIDGLLNPVAPPETPPEPEPPAPVPTLKPEDFSLPAQDSADADIQQTPTEVPQAPPKEPPQEAPKEQVKQAPKVPPKEKPQVKPKPVPKPIEKPKAPTKPKERTAVKTTATKLKPSDDGSAPSGISHGQSTQAGHGGTSDIAQGKQGDGKDAMTSASHRGSYLHNPKPPYPAMSIEKGEEGAVTLRVVVEPDGSPSQVEVIKSSGYRRLDRSALDTVRRQYKFIPATRLGKPIQSTYSFSINFSLRDQ